MKVVVFGANGGTGRLVTRQLLDAGHTRGSPSPDNPPHSRSATRGWRVGCLYASSMRCSGIEPRCSEANAVNFVGG